MESTIQPWMSTVPQISRRSPWRSALLVVGLALVSYLQASAAASLRSDVLFLLPKESGQVTFLDLQSLRASPHYSLLKQRMVTSRFRDFERFLRAAGVDLDHDLDWVTWVQVAPGPDRPGELLLGISQGRFVPEKVEQFFLQQELPMETYRGQTLFPLGDRAHAKNLFLTFLDSSTAAFGTRPGLELLLETRFGSHPNLLRNATLVERLEEVNGRVPTWVVSDEHYTRLAVRQLLPEVSQFKEFAVVADRFRSSVFRLRVDRAATLNFQAWCAEPTDAQTFSLLLQTTQLMQGWQGQQNNPTIGSFLARADVRTTGERLDVTIELEEQDVRGLLESSRFR